MIICSIDKTAYEVDRISYERYLSQYSKEDVPRLNLGTIMKTYLSKRSRQCLILYYVGNKKVCEIAKLLQISPATVSRDIKKAKNILIDKLHLQ